VGFNLILKRKPFAVIQVLCDSYEDRFKEKVATASVVNVLIAEALAARGLIPKDYVITEYGSIDPIKEGFTASARRESKTQPSHKEQEELERETRYFKAIFESEWETHPNMAWRANVIERAKKWPQIECARLIVELHGGCMS
jgi:hypothetical protein